MQENHYYRDALRLATDLVNRPPLRPEELADRWNELGLGSRARASDADLEEVSRFTQRWTAVIDARTEEERVALLNELLAEAAAYPRITDHDGSGWHLHYRDDDVPLAAMIRAVTAVAAAKHLTEHGMHRLGRCALAECAQAFVDLTRGGRQRYCTRVCANRDAVRRHRARHQR
ncbi:CGNR zinc finger domain-containing protein [Saccharopolyspora kobensis]|uniref:CGNR zinc finger domain-containing protein n=1 Tax=Saccharopolyspora kobensis TaxID=146035 RepID=UPI001F28E3DF|nr:CGNR zinc finger domain-containing protein [Saccharopolyspora kobensis]